jgi:hypothetical protein
MKAASGAGNCTRSSWDISRKRCKGREDSSLAKQAQGLFATSMPVLFDIAIWEILRVLIFEDYFIGTLITFFRSIRKRLIM